MDKYKFGEFIYQKRKQQGLTQEELGRKLGVTNKAVSKWEVGETVPEVTMLEPLASALNISVDELLTQKEKNKEEKKTIKLNKLFLILTIVLIVLNICSVIIFISYSSYMKNKEYPIVLSEENHLNIIDMDEMTNFICDGQSIIITSNYSLNNNYYIKSNEEISFVIEFVIEYYYYLDNDDLGMISYYARTEEIKFNENYKEEIKELKFSPKKELENFKCFKNVNVTYTISSYNGTVYKIK